MSLLRYLPNCILCVYICIYIYTHRYIYPHVAGTQDEFVFSGRLDNLAMSYCSLQALLDVHSKPDSLANDSTVKAVAIFDHEEVGSSSAQGNLFPSTLAIQTVCISLC